MRIPVYSNLPDSQVTKEYPAAWKWPPTSKRALRRMQPIISVTYLLSYHSLISLMFWQYNKLVVAEICQSCQKWSKTHQGCWGGDLLVLVKSLIIKTLRCLPWSPLVNGSTRLTAQGSMESHPDRKDWHVTSCKGGCFSIHWTISDQSLRLLRVWAHLGSSLPAQPTLRSGEGCWANWQNTQ